MPTLITFSLLTATNEKSGPRIYLTFCIDTNQGCGIQVFHSSFFIRRIYPIIIMRHFSFVEAVSEPFFDPKTTFAMPKSVLEEGQNRSENHCLEGISAGFFEEL